MGLAAATAFAQTGCGGGRDNYFTRLAEARRLAAELRVQFNRAADASNRAVMADTDEASIAYAAEAEEAKKVIVRDSEAIVPVLRALDYEAELQGLEDFGRSFAEYQEMDRVILQLAVENTNLKAQKLSFGPLREAADAFRVELESLSRTASKKNSCRVASLVYAAVVAVREIQVMEAPHIGEADDAVMTRMEKDMEGMEASARASLRELSALAEGASAEHLAAATSALDRFKETHGQIIVLSRKNTNVRSLAMSLGRKRTVTTTCDSKLATLQDELGRKGLKATR